MSFSAHINNKKGHVSIRNWSKQEFEHTLTAEKKYSINFTVTNKICIIYKFVLQWSK